MAEELAPLDAQDSLAALMIAVSASDENIRTSELVKITNAINNLPVFAGYDTDKLQVISQTVFDPFFLFLSQESFRNTDLNWNLFLRGDASKQSGKKGNWALSPNQKGKLCFAPWALSPEPN